MTPVFKDDDNKFIEGWMATVFKINILLTVDSKTEDDQFTCYLPSNENVKTRSESSTELKYLIDDIDNILNNYPPVSLLTEVDYGIDLKEVRVGFYKPAGDEVHHDKVHDYTDLDRLDDNIGLEVVGLREPVDVEVHDNVQDDDKKEERLEKCNVLPPCGESCRRHCQTKMN